MKDILVEDIIKITGGKLIIGDSKIICNQIGTDTRKIQKGASGFGPCSRGSGGREDGICVCASRYGFWRQFWC